MPSTTTKFTTDDLNPDGMFPQDIQQWIEFICTGPQIQTAAKQLFGDQDNAVSATECVLAYLTNKLAAMNHRISGNIPEALRFDNICDSLYNELPAYARW